LRLIGIDPGVNMGIAYWNTETMMFEKIASMKLYEVILALAAMPVNDIKVYIEDPNTFFGFKGTDRASHNARLQGAGSVKRSFSAIIEFIEDKNIRHERISLQGTLKKVTKQKFKMMTGYSGESNEHGRDAALMVFNRTK
jgi:hypothetical protein